MTKDVTEMTPEQEFEFYADPKNRETEGEPRRPKTYTPALDGIEAFDRINGRAFLVPSSDGKEPYKVFVVNEGQHRICTCKSFWFRDKACKHILLVDEFIYRESENS
jgi:hypothetical protein